VDFFEWRNLCEEDRYLCLEEFLNRHRSHLVFVIEEAIHQAPADADELRQLCGGDADVDYLGKDSPHWSDCDGLFYEITPKPRKGKKAEQAEPFHVVVYVF
jgi:hypothetical protein